MIQRQQSLWLLLSTICGILSFQFDFFSGSQRIGTNGMKEYSLTAGSTFFLLVLTGASILLSLVTIFLFKDRKLQFKLALVGAFISALIIVIYFLEIKKLAGTGSISLAAVFVFAILIGYIMAAVGIHKDQKLVKSLDKLR